MLVEPRVGHHGPEGARVEEPADEEGLAGEVRTDFGSQRRVGEVGGVFDVCFELVRGFL